jgi:hypothetical protein
MSWGPSLTSQQTGTATDRQAQLLLDIESLNTSIGIMESDRDLNDAIREVDKIVFDWFHAVAAAYEDEWRYLRGIYENPYGAGPPRTGEIGDGDLEDAVNAVYDCRLFPALYADPYVPDSSIDELNIIPTGGSQENYKESEYDEHVASNTFRGNHPLVYDCLYALFNGLTNGTADDTTAVADVIPTSTTVNVLNGDRFVNNDYAILAAGVDDYMVVVITGGAGGAGPAVLNIDVLSVNTGLIPIGSVISSLTATVQTLADNRMDALIVCLSNQMTALQSNSDDISSTQVQNEIETALANNYQSRTYYEEWRGSATRFSVTEMEIVLRLMTLRLVVIAARASQIENATATALLGIYPRRSSWLDTLVNRGVGSWTLYEAAVSSIAQTQSLLATQTKTYENYEEYLE